MIVVTKDVPTFEAMLAAIERVENVRVQDWKRLNAKGTRFQLKLGVKSSRGQYGRRSVSAFGAGRRVAALCWHGFRDAFRAAFEVDPQATFRTALDTWKGSEDFEARFEDSGFRVCGAPIAPYQHRQACACKGDGAFEWED